MRKITVTIAAAFMLMGFSWFGFGKPTVPDKPVTLKKHSAEIGQLLENAGWVSPGLDGPAIYKISFRACPDCVRFKQDAFPVLHKNNVDTRVIVFARADRNGKERSRVGERAAIAEIWQNRDWDLYSKWFDIPMSAYDTLEGRPADIEGNAEKEAIIQQGREFDAKLRELLADNKVQLAYPAIIWKAGDKWRVCMCEKPHQVEMLLKDLGVS